MKTMHLLRSPFFVLFFTLIYGVGAPVAALASTSSTSITQATAQVDPASLIVESSHKAKLYGTATSTTKIKYEITSASSSKVLAKSKTIKVHSDGTWSGSITKKLKDGSYIVTVYAVSGSKKKEVTAATLSVGVPAATLSVSSIPLLSGGNTTSGSQVPISYLQVRNQSATEVAIKGFWVTQRGTAPSGAVTGFSSVDDKALYRTFTENGYTFTNGKAYIPSTAIVAPGARTLFTLKAQVAPVAGAYAGTNLSFEVTGIDAVAGFTNTFPIQGTTWTIIR